MSFETNIIFLDRSAFESENFINSHKIKQLASFAKKGLIELYITEVTYKELQKGIKDNLRKSKKVIKAFKKELNSGARILRNLPDFEKYYSSKEVVLEEDCKEMIVHLDNFLKEGDFKIIPNGFINIDEVLNSYFAGEVPFGENHEKSEFPDAFILSAIENFSIKNEVKSYVLSNDGDLLSYDSPSKRVLPIEGMGVLIGKILKHQNKVNFNFIDGRAYQDRNYLAETIQNNYTDYFTDRLIEYIDNDPYIEDPEYSINRIIVNDLYSHNILDIYDDTAIVEYEFNVKLEVNLEYNDLSSGYYVREDGQYYGVEHINKDITFDCTVKLEVSHRFNPGKREFSIKSVDSFQIVDFEGE